MGGCLWTNKCGIYISVPFWFTSSIYGCRVIAPNFRCKCLRGGDSLCFCLYYVSVPCSFFYGEPCVLLKFEFDFLDEWTIGRDVELCCFIIFNYKEFHCFCSRSLSYSVKNSIVFPKFHCCRYLYLRDCDSMPLVLVGLSVLSVTVPCSFS